LLEVEVVFKKYDKNFSFVIYTFSPNECY